MKTWWFFIFIIFSPGYIFSQPRADSLSAAVKLINSHPVEVKTADTIPYLSLYFYRAYISPGLAPIKKVQIYINDSIHLSLKANTFIKVKMFAQGKLKIALDKKGTRAMTIDTKVGTEYFFRCAINAGLWFGKPALEAVTVEEGKEEAGFLRKDELSH